MDSEEESKMGIERAGVGGWGNTWWVIERGRIAWSTGCGAKTMNMVKLKRDWEKCICK